MESLWILLFLPFIPNCLVFYRLSTLGQQSLIISDYVYSTLGYFRFSLEQKSCQLKIQYFEDANNQNVYKTAGFFPKTTSFQCDQLVLNQTGLFTSKGKQFFFFRNQRSSNESEQDFAKNVRQTFLSIDDTGVMRLESIFTDQSTRQKWITNFKSPQKHLIASNNKIISAAGSFSLIRNNGDWGFSASKGQFIIFLLNDRTKIVRYKFLPFIISTNTFKDWNDFTTPLLNFEGLIYQRRCGISKQVSFRSPFVFEINKFWPQLRVLDQEGYQLFNLRYPSINCIKDVGVDRLNDNQDCLSWFCPPETFQLNGRCLARCPSPYFHQIKQNKKHRCVLICEAGSQIDNQTKICTCSKHQLMQCPFNMPKAPFGCLCQNKNYFFAGNLILTAVSRKLNQICLKQCPTRYYQHSDGICVSCPIFCLECAASNNSLGFLRCFQCQQYFQVFNGYCRKKCQYRIGNYLNAGSPSCLKCQTRFCKSCHIQDIIQKCKQCTLPYALFNNTCQSNFGLQVDVCPKNYILDFVKDQYFQCTPIKQCTDLTSTYKGSQISECKACGQKGKQFCFQSCDENIYQYFHNKSSCYCLEKASPSYALYCNYSQNEDRISLIGFKNFLENDPCPVIHHYFNYRTNQCLECPFGCLTCIVNEKGLPQCTSCVQNYYLSVYDINYCQKQTSLAYCYSFNRREKYCFSWDDIDTLVQKDSYHNACKLVNQNCFICLYNSAVYCKFCQNDHYLHHGKCIQSCPADFYPYQYQRVCLPKVIQNCIEQNIQSVNYLINANSNTQFTEGYRYFTSKYFTVIQNQNDPVGLIFVYYGYLKKKIDGERMSTFNKGRSVCKTCKQGYGLTKMQTCEKCLPNCQICIFSESLSCLKCHPFYYLSEKKQCFPLQIQKRPCFQGQFRNQKGICLDQCAQFILISATKAISDPNQKIINCTMNCRQSMRIMKRQNGSLYCVQTDVLSSPSQIYKDLGINIEDLIDVNENQIKLMSSCYSVGDSGFCAIVASSLIQMGQTAGISWQLMALETPRRLQEDSQEAKVFFYANKIYVTNLKTGLLKIQFQVSKVSNREKTEYLGNGVYGHVIQQGTSMLDTVLNHDHGMHNYSRTIVVLFLIIAVINFGKGLDYKLDNIFITMGTVYLALSGFDLNIRKGSYNLYGGMYGFSWAVGLEMLSNPRSLTSMGNFFQNNYIQKVQSNAHALLYVDNNLLRNCWSVFICIFIVLDLLIVSWIVIRILTGQPLVSLNFEPKNKQCGNQSDLQFEAQNCTLDETEAQEQRLHNKCMKIFPVIDFDHFDKITKFCVFIIENSALGLLYYSFHQITSVQWQLALDHELAIYKILAWSVLSITLAYYVIRGYANYIAGLYLFKRILLAFVLFWFPCSKGCISLFLGLFCVQLIFICLRVYFQNMRQSIKLFAYLKQKVRVFQIGSQRVKTAKTQSEQKLTNENQSHFKGQQPFQFQKAIISHKLLGTTQQIPKDGKISLILNKKLKSGDGGEITPSLWKQMSSEIKNMMFEETLVIIVYLSILLNELSTDLSILLIFLVLFIFLVIFIDQLILDLIEYTEITLQKIYIEQNSLVTQLDKKLHSYPPKYYFKIRNSFDFEQNNKNATTSQFSTVSTKQIRSSINQNYNPSIL